MIHPNLEYSYMLHPTKKGGLTLTRHSGPHKSGETSIIIPNSIGAIMCRVGIEGAMLLEEYSDEAHMDRRYLLLPKHASIRFEEVKRGTQFHGGVRIPYDNALTLRQVNGSKVTRLMGLTPDGQPVNFLLDGINSPPSR